MPTNRKRICRKLRERASTPLLLLLMGDASQARNDLDLFILTPEMLRQFWFEDRETILGEFTAKHPGRRPFLWWKFEAPEMRKRLGGIGDPAHEVLACSPSYHEGIPSSWIEPDDAVRFQCGTAIDRQRPPYYESQAAFLRRHGLLTPLEMQTLANCPQEFEPEVISPED